MGEFDRAKTSCSLHVGLQKEHIKGQILECFKSYFNLIPQKQIFLAAINDIIINYNKAYQPL
jgi:hypothetical protein